MEDGFGQAVYHIAVAAPVVARLVQHQDQSKYHKVYKADYYYANRNVFGCKKPEYCNTSNCNLLHADLPTKLSADVNADARSPGDSNAQLHVPNLRVESPILQPDPLTSIHPVPEQLDFP